MKKLSVLSVAIPHPCQASWEDMIKESSGRFCNSCSKSVIDFTTLSDAEIVDIIRQSPGKICGRFYPSQLNRAISAAAPSKQTILPAAAVLAALLLTNNLTIKAASPSFSVNLSPIIAPLSVNEQSNDGGSDSVRVINGKVSDSRSGNPLYGVVILIQGTKRGALTDTNGRFHIEVPDNLQSQSFTLECSFIGYEKMTRKVALDEKGNIEMLLRMEAAVSGDVVVYCHRRATLKERVVAKWRSLWK